MKSRTYFIVVSRATALVCMLAFGAAFAQSPPSDQPPAQGGGGHRHGPPAEAIAACANKAADDACSFTGRRGDTVTGKCATRPANPDANNGSGNPVLACHPDHMPHEAHAPGRDSGN
ncbi:MAG: hypothetical protein P4L92_20940 [Rudaea sp.]|nr:hypothetical protein [Rudaea sp.]